MKNMPKLLFTLVMCMAALTLPCAASEPQILYVNGEGRSEAAPDQATITIAVTTHAETSTVAHDANAAATNSVIGALKDLGIATKDIQTGNYSFYPTFYGDKERANEISGYNVNNSVIVTIQDIGLVGQVIDTALGHGANKINSLEFGLRDNKILRQKALKMAVADAREKAEIIAKELGLRIKGIQSISEDMGTAVPLRANADRLGKSANAMTFATAIEGGTLSLTGSVHINYIVGE